MQIWLVVCTILMACACGRTDSPHQPSSEPVPQTIKPPSLPPDPVKIETKEPSRFRFENRDLVFGLVRPLGQSYLFRDTGFNCYVGDEVTELGPRLPFYRMESRFDSRRRLLRLTIHGIQVAKTVTLKSIKLRDNYARLTDLRESQRRDRCGRLVVEQILFGDSIVYTADYRIPSNRRGLDMVRFFGDENSDIENLGKAVESVTKKFHRTRVTVERNRGDIPFDSSEADVIPNLVSYLKAAAENPLSEDQLTLLKLVQVGLAPAYR